MTTNFILEITFWICIALVFYAYVGYGFVLYLAIKIKRLFKGAPKNNYDPNFYPDVTFIVAAYNEERWIKTKLENCFAFDYPRERIHFFFVTDGSDDSTPELIENYPLPDGVNLRLFHSPERKGKIAAVERIMEFVESPITIYTDANTLVNRAAIKNIVRHYINPKVGAVAGEKRIQLSDKDEASSAGEGIYWKYESTLKKWDSELYSVVGAAGELFSIRTDLYQPVPQDTIIEDFFMTLRIAKRGYRVVYEPNACAVESSSASVKEELKRKIRIAAGGLQAIYRLAPLLNPLRFGLLSFQYISHRVLRWTLAPVALPIIFILNLLLLQTGLPLYQLLLVSQIVFYSLAGLGYLMEKRKLKFKIFFIPYYFCMMNYAVYRGFIRIVRGNQSVVWERAKRA